MTCGLSPGLCHGSAAPLLRCRDLCFLAHDMQTPGSRDWYHGVLIPRSSESRRSLPLKGDATGLRRAQSAFRRTYFTATAVENCGERDRDMARKKTGKRGSAIIVLMVVAAIAGGPSTAAASVTSQPLVSVAVPAPLLAPGSASWAEASWAEE